MRGLAGTVIIMVALFAVFALVGRAFGFEMALWPSLLISIVLTVGLNLLMGGFRRRSHW